MTFRHELVRLMHINTFPEWEGIFKHAVREHIDMICVRGRGCSEFLDLHDFRYRLVNDNKAYLVDLSEYALTVGASGYVEEDCPLFEEFENTTYKEVDYEI